MSPSGVLDAEGVLISQIFFPPHYGIEVLLIDVAPRCNDWDRKLVGLKEIRDTFQG